MSILQKPAKELSVEDFKAIEKPLGQRVPYPGMGLGYVVGNDGKKKLTRYLGVLETPLPVTSERELDEVEGLLIRNMPTPEMLKLFFEVMGAINPRNPRRAMYLKGAPGAGKTFLGELAGQVSSEKGALKIDCTNMNLNELFFETVLDFNTNKSFYDALNAKIEKYNEAGGNPQLQTDVLNPMSVDILRDCLGNAFTEERGKICIDWSQVKHSHNDGNGQPLETRENIEIAIAGLKQVSVKEGLDNLGGNALGMATQEGPAWQAYQEGRVLILDELNRAKRGTFGILHGWMQFVIGEIAECHVRNPLKEKGDQAKSELLFKRDEMASGHFVFMTGNTEDDSDEVLELPEALSSRVVPDPVAKATLQGWQHRWCQILTGMPISTLYYSQPNVWDKDKKDFTNKLLEWRVLRETKGVPEYQMGMLRRWEDIIEATENLARFMDSASKAIDPDSDWHKAGTLTQLLDDINDTFKKEVSVDFRKIGYFITKAMQSKPTVRPPQGDDGQEIIPLISDMDVSETPDDIRQKMGTHITYVILDWIISNSYERGKEDLGNQLMQIAADCALVDSHLAEGLPSSRKTIAELLDENPFDSNDPDVRATLVRDMLCDYLRQNFTEIEADNDDIMPVSVVSRAVAEIANSGESLIVFNKDPDAVTHRPFATAESVDMTPCFNKNPEEDTGNGLHEDPKPQEDAGSNDNEPAIGKPDASELLSQYALLVSLATPELREHNLKQLWNNALSDSGAVSVGNQSLVDESLAMAENKASNGIAVTTLMVRDDHSNKEVPLHVVWNKNTDRILVIGEGEISKDLKRSFNNAHISYVDRNDATAEKSLDRAFGSILGSNEGSLCDTVRDAFLMRNNLDDGSDLSGNTSLNKLLLDKKTECFLPHYIVDKFAKPGLAA